MTRNRKVNTKEREVWGIIFGGCRYFGLPKESVKVFLWLHEQKDKGNCMDCPIFKECWVK